MTEMSGGMEVKRMLTEVQPRPEPEAQVHASPQPTEQVLILANQLMEEAQRRQAKIVDERVRARFDLD